MISILSTFDFIAFNRSLAVPLKILVLAWIKDVASEYFYCYCLFSLSFFISFIIHRFNIIANNILFISFCNTSFLLYMNKKTNIKCWQETTVQFFWRSGRIRLNCATTHHNPPRSTTTHHHPPPSTTFHRQPKYIYHHQPPATIYPPLPIISQKMDHHPAKVKMYSYITSFRHCFNSFFFFQMQYSFPWRRFCVIKFW